MPPPPTLQGNLFTALMVALGRWGEGVGHLVRCRVGRWGESGTARRVERRRGRKWRSQPSSTSSWVAWPKVWIAVLRQASPWPRQPVIRQVWGEG